MPALDFGHVAQASFERSDASRQAPQLRSQPDTLSKRTY